MIGHGLELFLKFFPASVVIWVLKLLGHLKVFFVKRITLVFLIIDRSTGQPIQGAVVSLIKYGSAQSDFQGLVVFEVPRSKDKLSVVVTHGDFRLYAEELIADSALSHKILLNRVRRHPRKIKIRKSRRA
jgi:hypothetical protein